MAEQHTPPTPAELAAWQAATDAATPGPWLHKAGVFKHYVYSLDEAEDLGLSLQEMSPIDGHDVPAEANAQFIALARTAMPRLLAEVERLRALFAWEAGELTEKQAADLIANGDRLDAREMRLAALDAAKALSPKAHPADSITDEDDL